MYEYQDMLFTGSTMTKRDCECAKHLTPLTPEILSETVNYLGAALLGGATVVIDATPLPSTNAASTVVQ